MLKKSIQKFLLRRAENFLPIAEALVPGVIIYFLVSWFFAYQLLIN